jgi:hypothetical protein
MSSESGYKFLVADISHSISEASDNISKKLQIVGTNSGKYPIDLLVFVELKRDVTLDLQTGSLIA